MHNLTVFEIALLGITGKIYNEETFLVGRVLMKGLHGAMELSIRSPKRNNLRAI